MRSKSGDGKAGEREAGVARASFVDRSLIPRIGVEFETVRLLSDKAQVPYFLPSLSLLFLVKFFTSTFSFRNVSIACFNSTYSYHHSSAPCNSPFSSSTLLPSSQPSWVFLSRCFNYLSHIHIPQINTSQARQAP